MTPLPLVVLHTLVLGSNVRGNYNVQVRSEARARSAEPGDVATGPTSADLELNPSLSAGLDGGQTQGTVAYMPRLLIREPQIDGRAAFLHRGNLLLEHGAGRRVHTWFSQSAAYGVTQFSLLTAALESPQAGPGQGEGGQAPGGGGQTGGSAGPDGAVQSVPSLQGVDYQESDTRLGLNARLTSRLSLWSQLGWSVSGGATPEARLSVPLQRGPQAMLGLDHRATRKDTLRANVQGSSARFSSGQRASLLTFNGEVSHQFTRRTQGSAGVGLSQTWMQVSPTSRTESDLQPVASAGLTHQVPVRGQRLEGSLGAVLSPTIDRFNARVMQRLELSASANWGLERGLSATARGTYGQTLSAGNVDGERALVAEASAGYPLGHHWAVDGGVRGVWQRAGPQTAPATSTWLTFVAVTFTEGGAF